MARFITEFEQQILALGIPCDICIETLECKGIADAALWMSLIDNMITRYESRSLRAVVLLGQRRGLVRVAGPHSRRGHVLLRVRQFERRDASAAARFIADVEAPFGPSIRA